VSVCIAPDWIHDAGSAFRGQWPSTLTSAERLAPVGVLPVQARLHYETVAVVIKQR
jgi:hypothetical protein